MNESKSGIICKNLNILNEKNKSMSGMVNNLNIVNLNEKLK